MMRGERTCGYPTLAAETKTRLEWGTQSFHLSVKCARPLSQAMPMTTVWGLLGMGWLEILAKPASAYMD